MKANVIIGSKKVTYQMEMVNGVLEGRTTYFTTVKVDGKIEFISTSFDLACKFAAQFNQYINNYKNLVFAKIRGFIGINK